VETDILDNKMVQLHGPELLSTVAGARIETTEQLLERLDSGRYYWSDVETLPWWSTRVRRWVLPVLDVVSLTESDPGPRNGLLPCWERRCIVETDAVRFEGENEVVVGTHRIEEPGAGEVLVETERTLISTGTELTMLSGEFPRGSV